MKPIASASMLKVALLGGVAIGSLLSGAFQASAEVGVTAAVNVDARGRPPGGAPRVLALGANIVHNEQVTTDGQGLVQILLLDGTTFTVGPNSNLTIDEFVYNPETGDAKVVASLTKGVFRFVGARTSQTEGGATVKTPVGTIGIRGGVANFSYDPSTGESKSALIAGKSLTIVDGDGTQRIVYETGYTAVITRDQGGGTTSSVRKSTKEETGLIQQQLSSKPGQSGGTGNPPTDETVENSEVDETNSGLPDNMTVPGSLKPVQSSEPDQVEETAGVDGKTQDDLDNEIEDQLDDTPPPNARLLSAPDEYLGFPNPGPRGLVAGQNLVLVQQDGRLITSDGTTLNLPDYSGSEGDGDGNEYPELSVRSICTGECDDPATYFTDSLAGTAYAGRGDFVAYLLGIDDLNDDYDIPAERPVYVIYGTPTTDAQLEQFSDDEVFIREYTLTEDPIRQSPAPFFANDLYGGIYPEYNPYGDAPYNYNATNLVIVESDGGNARAFQSWISIENAEGGGQKSAAFVFTSGVAANGAGNLAIDGGRRGTFRHNLYAGPVNMRGGIATIAGATGDHFFGQNADHFVIGAGIDPLDAYADAPLDPDVYGETPGFNGYPFSTHHVANLVSETSAEDFGEGDLPGRTSRTVQGFMSGLGESSTGGAPYILASGYAEVDFDGPGGNEPILVPDFSMQLDSGNNSVSASGEVLNAPQNTSDVHSMVLAFGSSDNNAGNSAFVDDHRYGARRDGDNSHTGLKLDANPATVIEHFSGDDETAGSYLISGRASPVEGYQHCTQCDFIDWGWWGTRVRVDQNTGPGQDIRDEYVHMGTWVAGEIADVGDLPFSGNVLYDGTTLGTVARATGETYIATGTVSMTYDFQYRDGLVNLNLDGMYVNGSLTGSSSGPALFSGNLTGGGLAGSISGALVDDGPNVAAGAIGNFNFGNAGVSAVGTFAASQTNY